MPQIGRNVNDTYVIVFTSMMTKLLEKVDFAEVRKHCQWCDRLFRTLGEAIGAAV